jgi:hypothetical protein
MAVMAKDLTGQRFGRLCVMGPAGKKGKRSFWTCLCDCGKSKDVDGVQLSIGQTKSCGCYHQDMMRNRNMLSSGVSRFSYRKNKYVQCAKEKGIRWALNDAEVLSLFKAACTYCGVLGGNGIMTLARQGSEFGWNGIDRIDNSAGYEPGNVQACCSQCNYMRGSDTVDGFLSRVIKIYDYTRAQS